MDFNTIKYYLRHMPISSKIYSKLSMTVKGDKFKYSSLVNINNYKFVEKEERRITLVVPVLDSDSVFGGLQTAIDFFTNLSKEAGTETRILVLHGKYNSKTTFKIDGFDFNGINKNIIFIEENGTIPVGKNDLFIGTSWTTIYAIMPLIQKQINHFNLINRKLLYLIQDFEPGFFPWSTEFVLAESTYRVHSDDIFAIFNAKSLHDYFVNNGYKFGKELYFNPQLSSSLKNFLPKKETRRKKRILIYGRPMVSRNAFELIRAALDRWSEVYSRADEWEILSLGSNFNNIKLSNNIIISNGKVTLEKYAEYMKTTYAGISLMVSPHPSYPPLEMSTFGIKTITNSFYNKNISDFNKNIVNVDECTPEIVCQKLIEICESYYNDPKGKPFIDNEYVKGSSLYDIIKKTASYIDRT